jgi:hypothetical protein
MLVSGMIFVIFYCELCVDFHAILSRGDFAVSKEKNLCHVSDSPGAAAAEINLWFQPAEILSWTPVQDVWRR